MDRVTASVPEFTLSAQNEGALIRLCRQLEGIPLAIELAASRLKVLEIDELVERLRDRSITLRERNRSFPERHRTLEALIDWSHELCTPSERLLWARVSVFIGTFSLLDVEAVCSDDALPSDEVVDTLSSLVDRSVVIREVHGDRVRFRMLDTLRAYGQDKLAATGDREQWARRHRDWYAELISRAGDEWVGPKQKEWAERLRAEHPNIRLALEFSVTDPAEVDVALRMAATPWYWFGMEHLPEGRLWLARALALPSPASHDRAWALATDAYLATFQGDPAAAAQRARETHEMATALGDVAAQALAAHVTGVHLMMGEDPASALPHFREALELYAACDVQPQYHDGLLVEAAVTHIFLGERAEARERVDQLFARCQETGDRWQLAYALWGQAYLALLDGRTDGEPELLQAIAIKREFGDSLGLALTVEVLAWTTVRDDPERAARLLGIADSLWQSVGARQLSAQRTPYEEAARARLGHESFEALVAQGAAVDREDALAFALRERRETPTADPAQAADVLTARQREVAQLVAQGMSNKDIAAKLVISLRTAEGHVESILTKLGFTTRTQIATWVHQQH